MKVLYILWNDLLSIQDYIYMSNSEDNNTFCSYELLI